MDKIDYNQLVTNMPIAYSLHEMIYDSDGKPFDYRFLDVNKHFEILTGLTATEVRNRTCRELFPKTEQYWLDIFDDCIKNKKNIKYENYSDSLNGYYQVTCYSPAPRKFVTLTTDITEQRKTLQNLEKSEERYRLTQEVGGVGSWEYCIKTGKYWQSEYLCELFGVNSNEDEINNLIRSCIIDNSIFDQALENLIKNNIDLDIDFEIIRKNDGKRRILHTMARFINERDCNLGLVRGIISDITERRQEQTLISKSEANFRNLTESINDMVIIADFEGKIMYVNPSFCTKMMYSLEEMQNLTIFDLHPISQHEEVNQFFQAIIKKDEYITQKPAISYSFIDKNQKKYPVRIRINYGTWNNAEAIFGLIEDLTNEQEANARFDKIFRNNSAIMAITNYDNHEYVDVNDTFLELLGYKRSEVIGKTALELDLIFSDDIPIYLEAGKQMYKSGYFENKELRIKTKKGSILTGLFSGQFIENHGKKFGLTVMIDVTKRKYYENKLLENATNVNKILNVSSEFIKHASEKINYDEITSILRDITGAKHLLINVFIKGLVQTISYNGDGISVEEITPHLGFDLLTKKWPRDQVFENLWINNKITIVDSISQLQFSNIEPNILENIETMLNLGNVVIVRVDGINQVVGSFLFLLDKNENAFRNAELIEMFALQVGQYIERKRAEAILLQKMTEMERFHKLTINRELNMIELKKEVNELLKESGKTEKYLIVSN